MIKQIINQLTLLDKNKKNSLFDILNNSIDIKNYINTEYNYLMNEWNKKYSMFDIPNGLITISINNVTNCYNIGKPIYDKDTIFDIASESKVYTEFILFGVIEEYNINLNSKISDLSNNYNNIKDLTINDLISFNNTYLTEFDIRKCTNKKDALKALRTVYIDDTKQNYYLYTDLPIMILTDILEEYTGKSYYELFDKYIIKKYDLKNTFLEIEDDIKYVTLNKKLVNDPKACIMGGYYGHCGVKTTSYDFVKFINYVLNSKYSYLFVTCSNTLKSDDSKCINKALIGNSNLCVENGDSLASNYLPNIGFAIQGSLRCHCETCKINVDNKEYTITRCIFLDLYTQYDNAIKYEKETNNIITRLFNTDAENDLKMVDIRTILPYSGSAEFKKLVEIMSIASLIQLRKTIKIEK